MNKQHRRYLISFAIGFAVATSLVCPKAFVFGFVLFFGGLLILAAAYLVAIIIDRWL